MPGDEHRRVTGQDEVVPVSLFVPECRTLEGQSVNVNPNEVLLTAPGSLELLVTINATRYRGRLVRAFPAADGLTGYGVELLEELVEAEVPVGESWSPGTRGERIASYVCTLLSESLVAQLHQDVERLTRHAMKGADVYEAATGLEAIACRVMHDGAERLTDDLVGLVATECDAFPAEAVPWVTGFIHRMLDTLAEAIRAHIERLADQLDVRDWDSEWITAQRAAVMQTHRHRLAVLAAETRAPNP
jgi:hypothetical protein